MGVGGLGGVSFFVNGNVAATVVAGITAGAGLCSAKSCDIEMVWLLRVQIASHEGRNSSPYHKAHTRLSPACLQKQLLISEGPGREKWKA